MPWSRRAALTGKVGRTSRCTLSSETSVEQMRAAKDRRGAERIPASVSASAARSLRRGVARIPGQLQPALDVAGVGGGRRRILGEPLAGVAQPLRYRRQRLPAARLPAA